MKVVADSSPLIILAQIGCFDHIPASYGHIFITEEVHAEVVVAGSGLPGAEQVAHADWIKVREVKSRDSLATSQSKYRLGIGELSTLILAGEIGADAVIVDDLKARKLAAKLGFAVRGAVGLLEAFYRRGDIDDLRLCFNRLLASGAYVDRSLLNLRLAALGLPPL